MQTKPIPIAYQHISPAGAKVRVLMSNQYAGIAHCTLERGKITHAVAHKTVSEFWHILSGNGKIWRRNSQEESITNLTAGITIDIPLGTDFQYRSDAEDLVFICFTAPPWTGSDEAYLVEKGAWEVSLAGEQS